MLLKFLNNSMAHTEPSACYSTVNDDGSDTITAGLTESSPLDDSLDLVLAQYTFEIVALLATPCPIRIGELTDQLPVSSDSPVDSKRWKLHG